jgi:hypothetical protein
MIDKTTSLLSLSDLQYSNSGVYTCKVKGVEGCGTVESNSMVVYVISTPEITKQPQSIVNAKLGCDYSFDVQVHHRGIMPPYYKDKFQWYKYIKSSSDTVPLTNNNYISGADASTLIFTNIRNSDICKEGDFYFVKVEGLCGTVVSDPYLISQTPEVVIKDQPVDVNCCPGAVQVVFECTAIAPKGFDLEYQWFHDGKPLINNLKYNGTLTPKLQINNIQQTEEGAYTCQTNIVGETNKVLSKPANLKLKVIPTAQIQSPAIQSVKVDSDVNFQVGLSAGSEPIYIKWLYRGEIIKDGKWSEYDGDKLLSYSIESVSQEQSGEYICEISNDCDIIDFKFELQVTKWDIANSVEKISQNAYSLYSAVPNPVNNESEIKFITPNSEKVLIQLVNTEGKVCAELFNSYSVAGENFFHFNADELNLSVGVYHYVMTAGEFIGTRKLIIIR